MQIARAVRGWQNAFSGVDEKKTENDSCGGRSIKLGLGKKVESGQFELGKKTEEWKQLEQTHRGGWKASGLGFPSSTCT